MNALVAGNPLKEILSKIPDTLSVLDIALLDDIREIITKHNPGVFFTNKYVLLLLDHLMQSKLLYMHQITSKDVPGVTILIMKL